MNSRHSKPWLQPVILLLLLVSRLPAETFRVATYNLENYLDQPTESRAHTKSTEARAKIREGIRALNPDVLALEEMGSTNALFELRASLKAEGLDLPYWEHITGWDTNIHLAVLSRFPIAVRRPHTNDNFLLGGRRFQVSRGFLELDINVNTHFSFTLLSAHLKSRRPGPEADESEQRIEEARLLREIVDARFHADPHTNLIVLGDFNDTPNAASTKLLIGRGRGKLVDTRPSERNGDNLANPGNPNWAPRNIAWTHYYGAEDTYSRIDYILLSPTLARHWVTNETYVLTIPNWGIASDHRPLVATFEVKSD